MVHVPVAAAARTRRLLALAFTSAIVVAAGWVLLHGAPLQPPGEEPVAAVSGTVTLRLGDGGSAPASGVRLMLTCKTEPALLAVADEAGAFRFEHVPASGCAIATDLQGFRAETRTIDARISTELHFRLEAEPVSVPLVVSGVSSIEVRQRCHLKRDGIHDRPQPSYRRKSGEHPGSKAMTVTHSNDEAVLYVTGAFRAPTNHPGSAGHRERT